jgi:hypothetical protein
LDDSQPKKEHAACPGGLAPDGLMLRAPESATFENAAPCSLARARRSRASLARSDEYASSDET